MLTHAQRMELEAAFRRFDIDGNGSIDSTELQTVMQQLGSAANEQTEELLNSMDLDKNGRVEWNEFALLMADRWIRQDGQTDIEMAMTLFLSESGQGVLDLKKMRELLCTTGEAPLSEEEFDQIAEMADPEGSGKVRSETFKALPCWLPPMRGRPTVLSRREDTRALSVSPSETTRHKGTSRIAPASVEGVAGDMPAVQAQPANAKMAGERAPEAEAEQKKAQEVGEEETQEKEAQGAHEEEEEAYAETSEAAETEAAETEAAEAMPSASLEDVMALLQQAEGHTVAVGRLKKPQGPSGLKVAVEELTTQEVASQHKLA